MFAFCSFIEQQNKSDHMRASALSAPQCLTHYVLTMSPTGQWCQSGHQENSLPGPLLRQPHHHHPQLPTSFKSLRRCHSEHARAKRAEVWDRVLYPSEKERQSSLSPYKSLSVSDSATLRSQELPTAHSHPAASSTAPHWQPGRHRQRKKRGERRVLLSCSLTVLFVRPFLWPVHYRGNSWVYVNPRTASLFCNTQTHISQILTSVISRTESRIEAGNRVWTGARMSCERQQWKHYKTYCHRHTNTQRVKRDTDAEVRATRV